MTSFICSCLDTEGREYHVFCELACEKLESRARAAGRLNPSACSHPDNDGNEAVDDDGAKVACPRTHPWHNTFLLHVSLLTVPFPPPPPLRIYQKRLHAPSVAVCFLSHWHHGAASAGSIPLNEPFAHSLHHNCISAGWGCLATGQQKRSLKKTSSSIKHKSVLFFSRDVRGGFMFQTQQTSLIRSRK